MHVPPAGLQVQFPTFSRISAANRHEAAALAQVVHSLGLTRVGIAFSRNTYGSDMNAGFTAACNALNISVVASAGMDFLQQLTPTQQAAAQASFAAEVQTKFTRANVKVYLLALDGTDVKYAAFILHSMGFLAEGHTVLLPSHLVLWASSPNPQNVSALTAIQNMLKGGIGIYPVSDSVTAAEMTLWEAWPKNAANWSALLATHRQLANVTNLAPPDPVYISLWARYVWDGTLFLAKAISTAFVQCELAPPFYDSPSVQCLVDIIRNTTLNGTTGPITLDNNGDRTGQFGVFNIVNRQRVQTGTVDSAQGIGDVGVDRIVWSDGVSNRSAAPAWGQDPHPSTPAPTAVPPGERSVSESENTLYIAIVSSVLLMLVFLAIVYRQHRRKVNKMRPMDFRKVP
jgi:ABC-type branched-subunit amino acid transport system substrate-binding protein